MLVFVVILGYDGTFFILLRKESSSLFFELNLFIQIIDLLI